jgi:signal transduction histidine kinase
MKDIYCLGKGLDSFIAPLQSKGFTARLFSNAIELQAEITKKSPLCVLIQDLHFDEFQSQKIVGVPFIVYTTENIDIAGYDFFRKGALDYFSTAENFLELLLDKLEKYISVNKKDLLDKILHESENLYFSIIEKTPILTLVLNREGQIIIANEEAKRLMKTSEEKDRVEDYLDPVLAKEFLDLLKAVRHTSGEIKFQCSIIKNEDDLTPIMWHIDSFDHVIDDTVVAFGQNISTSVEMRKKEFYQTKSLLVLNDRLERSNKSLDQFSRMISHDLKNGLNRIMGFTRMLMQIEKNHLTAEGLEVAGKISQNTDDMVLTVNRILDFAQSKGSNLQIQKFAINELIQKILLGFHEQIQEINGRYELESELIEVEADPICMKQIFENLISNAIKYRSSERTFLLKVSIMDMGADILIVFEDNGIGIKPGDEEKLFDEYYRNKDIADKVEGHGIGLSTVKTLLDSHGGVIWVDPEAIVGSSFNLQLPKLQ